MREFDPIAYINEPRWRASRLGLSRIRQLLDLLGRPQDRLRFVHVAGTNGKGSTCAYLARILQEAGYKTGLFTSPYILRFQERIRVDGQDIDDASLLEVTLAVREHAAAIEAETGEHPTEFELMTAVAFEHFARSGCDIAVVEVGLGGRLDSTNVIERPEACVITRIGLDHTNVLGDTLAAIAAEKAGILKPGVPALTCSQEPEAMKVIQAAARKNGCSLAIPDFSQLRVGEVLWPKLCDDVVSCGDAAGCSDAVGCSDAMQQDGGSGCGDGVSRAHSEEAVVPLRSFEYKGKLFFTRLLGSYQPENAALAIEAARVLQSCGWIIPPDAIHAGIAKASWPGRFEVMQLPSERFEQDASGLSGSGTCAADAANSADAAKPAAGKSVEPVAGKAANSVAGTKSAVDAAKPVAGAVKPAAGAAKPAAGAVAGQTLVIDGGHNPQGAAALAASLRDVFPQEKPVFICGILADKDYCSMLACLAPLARAFVCVTPDNPRALPAEELARVVRALLDAEVPVVCAGSMRKALVQASAHAGSKGLICAFGSLYSIGALKEALA